MVLWIIAYAVMIFALADAASRPGEAWTAAGRSKFLWVVVLTFGVFAPIFGMQVFVIYDDVLPEPLGSIPGVTPVSVTTTVGVLFALRYFLRIRPGLAGGAQPGCLTAVLVVGSLVVAGNWILSGGPSYSPVTSERQRLIDTPVHAISTPLLAGGLTRDDAAQIPGSAEVKRAMEAPDGDYRYARDAVYTDAGGTKYAFLGGIRKYEHDLESSVENFRENLEGTWGTRPIVTEIAPGPGGGSAMCGQNPDNRDVLCEWTTEDSFGQVRPLNIGTVTDLGKLADITRRIRTGVEK
ncbi:DUF2516 family protein [Sphaerisporangium aureirubrum]|uniref:DUF2516 family protein n=2 Tax=Sphaerisporangium aureirubrum TaxID=1544736 RepID=A0ABW1NQ47_9ACTN